MDFYLKNIIKKVLILDKIMKIKMKILQYKKRGFLMEKIMKINNFLNQQTLKMEFLLKINQKQKIIYQNQYKILKFQKKLKIILTINKVKCLNKNPQNVLLKETE